MNLGNIISAGRMLSIVVMLLGAFHCGATLSRTSNDLFLNLLICAVLVASGIAVLVLLSRAQKCATMILVLGSMALVAGSLDVVLTPLSPFAWMAALVTLTLFIDTLCLKLALSPARRPH